MARKRESEEQVITSDDVGTVPPPPTNGDSKPAKKPPRDKAEAFKRVGNQRVQKAIYAMRRLLPLANRNAYTYTPEQAKVMIDVTAALAKEVEAVFSMIEEKDEPPPSFL